MHEWWRDAGAVGDARDAIAVVSGKWVLAVLQALVPGPLRHNELHRAVGSGIRPQVLDDTLRRLEADGIIVRRARAGTPPAVSYELSGAGRSLGAPLAGLAAWVGEHRDELRAPRSPAGRPVT